MFYYNTYLYYLLHLNQYHNLYNLQKLIYELRIHFHNQDQQMFVG